MSSKSTPTLFDMTIYELAARFYELGRCKTITATWHHVQRAGWATRLDAVRGVVISVPVKVK